MSLYNWYHRFETGLVLRHSIMPSTLYFKEFSHSIFFKDFISLFIVAFHLGLVKASCILLRTNIVDKCFIIDKIDSNK